MSDTQSTHSADCYKWHHKCAIGQVDRLREDKQTLNNIVAILGEEINRLREENERLRKELAKARLYRSIKEKRDE